MATPQEKLAQSLEVLKAIQDKSHTAIRTKELSRLHRERLLDHGFIKEVILLKNQSMASILQDRYQYLVLQMGLIIKKIGDTGFIKTSLIQGRNRIETKISCKAKNIKKLKIKAYTVNPIPDGHHKAGKKSFLLIDEIMVF